MMISSLMNKFSTIVRLVPLGSSSARELYPIVKNTICDIESCNLFVEAVCTDNYPFNVNLFKIFSHASGTLHPKVKHPCNPTRNLILFFDIVHIIKSIRNNWLNLKDYDRTFIFPKFEDCTQTLTNVIYPSCNQLIISIPITNVNLNPIELTSSLYPSFSYAVFEDLRNMYKADKFSVIKRASNFS